MRLSPSGCVCVLLAGLMAGSGCANHTRTGALVGTGIGTAAGAIIGHQMGKGKEGALIGAALGAGTGALAGNARDANEQRDAAMQHASHAEASRQAHARAMTNRDVLDLKNGGLSDQYCINEMANRGGMFDLSTTSVISLKQAGVSEVVLDAMRRYNMVR